MIPDPNLLGAVLDIPAPRPSFLKIHKNGGTSVAQRLLYKGPMERRETRKKEEWWSMMPARPLVVMWRNPADRTASAFNYFRSFPDRTGSNWPSLDRGFKWFVLALCDTDACLLRFRDPHLVPQYWFAHYFPEKGGPVYLPTQEFWWDWEGLRGAFGLKEPFPHLNTSSEVHTWDDAMIEAHRVAFAWDWSKWDAKM